MKRTFLTVATGLALAGSMTLPLNLAARAGGAFGAPAGQGERKERREPHPEIRQAIRHLEMAKQALQRGAHDLGGHRAEALKHTDEAIEECRRALQSDVK